MVRVSPERLSSDGLRISLFRVSSGSARKRRESRVPRRAVTASATAAPSASATAAVRRNVATIRIPKTDSFFYHATALSRDEGAFLAKPGQLDALAFHPEAPCRIVERVGEIGIGYLARLPAGPADQEMRPVPRGRRKTGDIGIERGDAVDEALLQQEVEARDRPWAARAGRANPRGQARPARRKRPPACGSPAAFRERSGAAA